MKEWLIKSKKILKKSKDLKKEYLNEKWSIHEMINWSNEIINWTNHEIIKWLKTNE